MRDVATTGYLRFIARIVDEGKQKHMARLNIEDSFFLDSRFFDLCIALKDRYQATGVIVWAWRLAQKHYLKNDGIIPLKEWNDARLPEEIITVGLAEIVESGIKMKGTDDQFAWLRQKQSAGKSSSSKNSSDAKNTKNQKIDSVQRPSTSVDARQPLYSFLFSPNTKEEELRTKERVNAPDEINQDLVEGNQNPTQLVKRSKKRDKNPNEGNQDFAQLVGSVVSVYQKKFKARPALGGKEIGILKRLSRDYKPVVLINLLETFFQMRDKWFQTKAWDLATFEQNIHKVSISLQTGRELTGATNVLSDFLKEHSESISLGVRDEN